MNNPEKSCRFCENGHTPPPRRHVTAYLGITLKDEPDYCCSRQAREWPESKKLIKPPLFPETQESILRLRLSFWRLIKAIAERKIEKALFDEAMFSIKRD